MCTFTALWYVNQIFKMEFFVFGDPGAAAGRWGPAWAGTLRPQTEKAAWWDPVTQSEMEVSGRRRGRRACQTWSGNGPGQAWARVSSQMRSASLSPAAHASRDPWVEAFLF